MMSNDNAILIIIICIKKEPYLISYRNVNFSHILYKQTRQKLRTSAVLVFSLHKLRKANYSLGNSGYLIRI